MRFDRLHPVLFLFFLGLAACGSEGDFDASENTGQEEAGGEETILLKGSLLSTSPDVSTLRSDASEKAPDICQGVWEVKALANDASFESSAEVGEDCSFELEVRVGKAYTIHFLDEGGESLGILVSEEEEFEWDEEGGIDLGMITLIEGRAWRSGWDKENSGKDPSSEETGVFYVPDDSSEEEAEIFGVSDVVFGRSRNLSKELGVIGLDQSQIGFRIDESKSTPILYGFVPSTEGIYLITSEDGGENFGKTLIYSGKTYGKYLGETDPRLALDSDENIFVVWTHLDIISDSYGTRALSAQTYFSQSRDRGSTFIPPIKLQDKSQETYQWNPAVAVDSQKRIHVAWNARHLAYYARSVDEGATFSSPVVLAQTKGNLEAHPHWGIGPNDKLYLMYADAEKYAGEGNLYLIGSEDGGATFSSPVRVNDEDNAVYGVNGNFEFGVAPDGKLHVIWVQGIWDRKYTFPQYVGSDLYSSTSSDGKKFKKAVKISQTPLNVLRPDLIVDFQGSPHACWQSDSSLRYAKKIKGEFWTGEQTVGTARGAHGCQITVDRMDHVYILESAELSTDSITGIRDLFFIKSL